MKGLFIAGIVVASLAIFGSLSFTGSELAWGVGVGAFYLWLSISAYNLTTKKKK